jgi:hypothetical protein
MAAPRPSTPRSAPRALDLLKDRRPALISTEIPSEIDVSQATPILDA